MDIERSWYCGWTYFIVTDKSLINYPIGSMKARVSKLKPNQYNEYLLNSVQDRNKKFVYLSNFGIDADFRHLGYGRMLLRYVIGCYHDCNIYLHASSCGRNSMTNDQLIDFYKSEGFRIADGWQEGSDFPVLVLEL